MNGAETHNGNGTNGTHIGAMNKIELPGPPIYTEAEVRSKTLEYFSSDELAADTIITKYLLKDREGRFRECSPDDIHHREAREFARIEAKFGGASALSKDEIYESLRDFKEIIPQGSPMYGIGNDYALVSLSNCVVVQSPGDDISSIMNQGKDLANLFKRRCGVGVDLSDLRPEGSSVSNAAGTTTGAWSFADFYSYVCRMIGQNGRRGALMITLDVRHPDIERFIAMKQDKTKVTGANVSVKIRDDFMRAVEADETFQLRWPVDSKTPRFTREVRARDLWDQIIKAATDSAEPGLMMWDNILSTLPAECYAEQGFRTITTNPCGEIPLSAYDSCRLIAINISTFVMDAFTDNAHFDFDAFAVCVRKAMRLSDDLVELELEKLQTILSRVDTEDEKVLWANLLKAAKNGRRTGLGTLALGDTMAMLKLRYGSPEAVEMTDKIYAAMAASAYDESVELAKERGAFPVFDWEKEKDNIYIKRLPAEVQAKMAIHGRRNISILTNAPTGSMSICAQASSGIEPVFRNSYVRRKKINHNATENVRVDYTDQLGDKWQEFTVLHHNASRYIEKFGGSVDTLPDYFITSDQIPWRERIDMQAAVQRHIDHSISSTINLPAGTTTDTVAGLYFYAWKQGLKGVTIYVDGSRSGVLVTKKDDPNKINYREAPKRPIELPCEIHRAFIRGTDGEPQSWTLLVGLLDGKPYEVFGGLSEFVDIPEKYTSGVLIKNPRKSTNARYDLRFGEEGSQVTIKNIAKVFENPLYGSVTRLISMSLRHGVPIQYVVEQLLKDDEESGMFSFSKVVARTIKKHIPDGLKQKGKTCSSCTAETLVYQEGCATCTSCGFAKCG
jgi:ribonucleoside-diphosphate reductase alpha chain